MTVQSWIEEARKEGMAHAFVVYANIGNNSDELVVCEACEADACGCVIVDIYYIEHSAFMRTAVITAEVV
jgi:hypothetical protein